jgi:hypothetical protein
MKPKTLEEKLFVAYRHNRGVRLTADDVWMLIEIDGAMSTRIARIAWEEAGLGDDTSDIGGESIKTTATTWGQFVAELARKAGR